MKVIIGRERQEIRLAGCVQCVTARAGKVRRRRFVVPRPLKSGQLLRFAAFLPDRSVNGLGISIFFPKRVYLIKNAEASYKTIERNVSHCGARHAHRVRDHDTLAEAISPDVATAARDTFDDRFWDNGFIGLAGYRTVRQQSNGFHRGPGIADLVFAHGR